MFTRLAAISFLLFACSRPSAPEAPPPSAPVSLPPPAAPAAPPPAPAPAASVLRPTLLAATDVETFRALAADPLVISVDTGKNPRPTSLAHKRLDDAAFKRRIQPLLPREPDPADGEGEDFTCDDAAGTCVFRDAVGNATTYSFTKDAPPKLREIRKAPPAK